MMNLHPRKVFIPVDVSDELPPTNQDVIISPKDEKGNFHGDGFIDERGQWYLGDHKLDFPIKFTRNVSYWLKESTSIVINENDLVELLKEAHEKGSYDFATDGKSVEDSWQEFLRSKGLLNITESTK